MTQLLFIHGVATRTGPGHQASSENRDRLIRDILFEGTAVSIRAPNWGDLVPEIDRRIFATAGGVQSFSLGLAPLGMGSGLTRQAASAAPGTAIAAVARANPASALDAIFATLLEQADQEGRPLSDREFAAFRTAAASLAADDDDSAIRSVSNDDEVVFELEKGLGTYGIGSTIRDAVSAVADRLRNTISTVAFDAVRDRISPAVALFLGDVFVYLKQGQLRDRIRNTVARSIREAHSAAKAAGEPMVIIGHSLGGVIVCDMLSEPAPELPEDLSIAALLTVGSQPGLFQSMGVFAPPPPAGGRSPKPACVGVWYNVFDPIDPLAFRADPMFEGVEDLAFDSVTGLASAHTTYFKRPQFYARCRRRLRDLQVI
jgi:hypothetical protein